MFAKKWTLAIIILFALAMAAIAAIFFLAADQRLQTVMFIASYLVIIGLSVFIAGQRFNKTNEAKPHSTNILLVDDSKANRRIAMELLSPLSLNIIEASNGQKAIDLYQKTSFTLILMDIEMQELNGLDVTRKIRKLESGAKRTPIVAISAHSSNEKKLEALTAGYDEYLSKPLDSEQLLTTLNRWLINSPAAKPHASNSAKHSSLKHETSFEERGFKPVSHLSKATLEFIQEKSVDDSGTIKKVVDVKQSLKFSRNNYGLAKDMLSMLIEMVQQERNQAELLYKEKKWGKLGDLVHKINGGSCYCGVPELQQQTQAIDSALEKKEIDTVIKHFPAFLQAMDELLEWNEEHDIDIIFDH